MATGPILPQWQVDAFAAEAFRGNPAAVVPLDDWLPDATLQAIALENNLSETAFLVKAADGEAGHWQLRWFTPAAEVDLCGHATLASAFVVDRLLTPGVGRMRFETRSGTLTVEPDGERYRMSFPARPCVERTLPDLAAVLGRAPEGLWQHGERGMLLALLPDAAAVRAAAPDLRALGGLPADGLIVTAPGEAEDFVSRYFAPHVGIDEDPVTGSAHCLLAPFWAARLGRESLFARQVSARGGELWLRVAGERVEIAGQARLFLEGRIHL